LRRHAKQTEAELLIAVFARELLKLSGGKRIPQAWKQKLLRAIEPVPGVGGRPKDESKHIEAVALLIQARKEARASRPNARSNLDDVAAIADRVGLAQRTVERIRGKLHDDAEIDPITAAGIAKYLDGALDRRQARVEKESARRAEIAGNGVLEVPTKPTKP
jgi:hypothetical protein